MSFEIYAGALRMFDRFVDSGVATELVYPLGENTELEDRYHISEIDGGGLDRERAWCLCTRSPLTTPTTTSCARHTAPN